MSYEVLSQLNSDINADTTLSKQLRDSISQLISEVRGTANSSYGSIDAHGVKVDEAEMKRLFSSLENSVNGQTTTIGKMEQLFRGLDSTVRRISGTGSSSASMNSAADAYEKALEKALKELGRSRTIGARYASDARLQAKLDAIYSQIANAQAAQKQMLSVPGGRDSKEYEELKRIVDALSRLASAMKRATGSDAASLNRINISRLSVPHDYDPKAIAAATRQVESLFKSMGSSIGRVTDDIEESIATVGSALDASFGAPARRKIEEYTSKLGGVPTGMFAIGVAVHYAATEFTEFADKMKSSIELFNRYGISIGKAASSLKGMTSEGASYLRGFKDQMGLTVEQTMEFASSLKGIRTSAVSLRDIDEAAQGIRDTFGQIDIGVLRELVDLSKDIPKEQLDIAVGIKQGDQFSSLMGLVNKGKLSAAIDLYSSGAFGEDIAKAFGTDVSESDKTDAKILQQNKVISEQIDRFKADLIGAHGLRLAELVKHTLALGAIGTNLVVMTKMLHILASRPAGGSPSVPVAVGRSGKGVKAGKAGGTGRSVMGDVKTAVITMAIMYAVDKAVEKISGSGNSAEVDSASSNAGMSFPSYSGGFGAGSSAGRAVVGGYAVASADNFAMIDRLTGVRRTVTKTGEVRRYDRHGKRLKNPGNSGSLAEGAFGTVANYGGWAAGSKIADYAMDKFGVENDILRVGGQIAGGYGGSKLADYGLLKFAASKGGQKMAAKLGSSAAGKFASKAVPVAGSVISAGLVGYDTYAGYQASKDRNYGAGGGANLLLGSFTHAVAGGMDDIGAMIAESFTGSVDSKEIGGAIGGAVGGALTGATIGMIAGPIGAGIGAAIGATIGTFGAFADDFEKAGLADDVGLQHAGGLLAARQTSERSYASLGSDETQRLFARAEHQAKRNQKLVGDSLTGLESSVAESGRIASGAYTQGEAQRISNYRMRNANLLGKGGSDATGMRLNAEIMNQSTAAYAKNIDAIEKERQHILSSIPAGEAREATLQKLAEAENKAREDLIASINQNAGAFNKLPGILANGMKQQINSAMLSDMASGSIGSNSDMLGLAGANGAMSIDSISRAMSGFASEIQSEMSTLSSTSFSGNDIAGLSKSKFGSKVLERLKAEGMATVGDGGKISTSASSEDIAKVISEIEAEESKMSDKFVELRDAFNTEDTGKFASSGALEEYGKILRNQNYADEVGVSLSRDGKEAFTAAQMAYNANKSMYESGADSEGNVISDETRQKLKEEMDRQVKIMQGVAQAELARQELIKKNNAMLEGQKAMENAGMKSGFNANSLEATVNRVNAIKEDFTKLGNAVSELVTVVDRLPDVINSRLRGQYMNASANVSALRGAAGAGAAQVSAAYANQAADIEHYAGNLQSYRKLSEMKGTLDANGGNMASAVSASLAAAGLSQEEVSDINSKSSGVAELTGKLTELESSGKGNSAEAEKIRSERDAAMTEAMASYNSKIASLEASKEGKSAEEIQKIDQKINVVRESQALFNSFIQAGGNIDKALTTVATNIMNDESKILEAYKQYISGLEKIISSLPMVLNSYGQQLAGSMMEQSSQNLDAGGISANAAEMQKLNRESANRRIEFWEEAMQDEDEQYAKALESVDRMVKSGWLTEEQGEQQKKDLSMQHDINQTATRASIVKEEVEAKKKVVEIARRELELKRGLVSLDQDSVDMEKDYIDSIGGSFEAVISLEAQSLEYEREKAELAREAYENAVKEGASEEDQKKLRNEARRAEIEFEKKKLGAQRSAAEKFLGSLIGSFSSVGAFTGLNDAAIFGAGYTKNEAGVVIQNGQLSNQQAENAGVEGYQDRVNATAGGTDPLTGEPLRGGAPQRTDVVSGATGESVLPSPEQNESSVSSAESRSADTLVEIRDILKDFSSSFMAPSQSAGDAPSSSPSAGGRQTDSDSVKTGHFTIDISLDSGKSKELVRKIIIETFNSPDGPKIVTKALGGTNVGGVNTPQN